MELARKAADFYELQGNAMGGAGLASLRIRIAASGEMTDALP